VTLFLLINSTGPTTQLVAGHQPSLRFMTFMKKEKKNIKKNRIDNDIRQSISRWMFVFLFVVLLLLFDASESFIDGFSSTPTTTAAVGCENKVTFKSPLLKYGYPPAVYDSDLEETTRRPSTSTLTLASAYDI
jgi:hypothetical protein